MADQSGPVKLTAFPRLQLVERELFAGTASEVDLLAALGDPSGENVPALGAGRPLFFWDLSFACGLVMGLQFDQIDQRLTGYLDAPEVEHALRHLGVEVDDLWMLERDDPERFAAVCDVADRSYAVATADGTVVAEGLTERDARCRCVSAGDEDGPLVLVSADGVVIDLDAAPAPAPERPVAPPPPPPPPRAEPGAPAAPDLAGALAARVGSRPRPPSGADVGAAPPPGSPLPPPPPTDDLPGTFDPGEGGRLESFDDDEFGG